MQHTQKTTAPGYPPYFLTGTNGTNGTALSGAGFSRPGERDSTGTDRDRQATTSRNGERLTLETARKTPLFWRKGCLRATPTGQFSEQRMGKKIAMILTAISLAASGFGHRPVDNSPRFRGVVDNFSHGPVCVPAHLLSNLCKSPESIPGAACGQIGAKVMHSWYYA